MIRSQTLVNKTLLIDEDNFVITDGDEEAIFQINWATSSMLDLVVCTSYLMRVLQLRPSRTYCYCIYTLLDTKAEHRLLCLKRLLTLKLAANAELAASWAQFNTDALTMQIESSLFPINQGVTLVGEDSTQALSNKSVVKFLLLLDQLLVTTKRATFSAANQQEDS